jgi:hypothetical protein
MIGFLPEERGTVVVLRTGSATDIVESEVSDAGVHLEEERERLADTTSSTENGDLGKVPGGGGESTALDTRSGEHFCD